MAALSVSAVAGNSGIVKYYCCTICEKERSVEVDADYYCRQCLKYFCRKCIHSHSQHGWWFYKQSPYGKDKIMKWPLSKKMENSLRTCDIHKGEKLTMYCLGHSQLCCSRCVELDHRICLGVTPLPQTATGMSTTFKNLSVRIQNTLSQMKQFQTYQEGRIMYLKVSYNEDEKLILDCIRRNIISFLLQCENSLVNETYENVVNTVNEMREKVTSLLADFENSNVKEKKKELTLKLAPLIREKNSCIRLHHQLCHLHVAMQKLHDRPELSFIASTKCQEKIQQFEKYLQESCSNNFLIVNAKSEHIVRIPSDSITCCITAICVLPDGQVLVADCFNYKVKLLNQQYQVVSHCGVAACPQGMCLITPSEVAMAVDYRSTHEVQFITVKQSQLVPGRKFQLQHRCIGMAHNQGDLFITSDQALVKYSLSGKQVCRLYEDKSFYNTVNRCAVSPTGDKLYITSYYQAKLITLARDGTLLATLTDPELRGPEGLHVTSAGQVLVWRHWSHTILQVDREGRKLATLATYERDGVAYLESVCYSCTTSSIIVGQAFSDNILVLRVE